MTEEIKRDLETVLTICKNVAEIYVIGDFSIDRTDPYLYVFVNEEDSKVDDYQCEVMNYILEKYDAWGLNLGNNIFVYSNITNLDIAKTVKSGLEEYLVYKDWRWCC